MDDDADDRSAFVESTAATAVDHSTATAIDRHELVSYIADISADPEVDRAGLDSLGELIVMVDSQMRIVRVNRKVEIVLGYTRLELMGQPVEILVPEAKRATHASVHTPSYMSFPESKQMASRLQGLAVRTKEGKELPTRISLEPFTISRGRFVSAVLYLRGQGGS